MTRVLHLLVRPDPVGEGILEAQRKEDGVAVTVIDLRQGAPDYEAVLDAVFAADSVAVW